MMDYGMPEVVFRESGVIFVGGGNVLVINTLKQKPGLFQKSLFNKKNRIDGVDVPMNIDAVCYYINTETLN